MTWQRKRINLKKKYSPAQRKEIADDIINFIIERTRKGENINHKSFPKYSKSYKDSLDFLIAGKKGKPVNLTLSGEMLNKLELISQKADSILIGFDKGDEKTNDKVEGNRLGSYGSSPDKKKARDFLGITQKDLNNKILKDYVPIKPKGILIKEKTSEQLAEEQRTEIKKRVEEFTDEFLESIEFL